MKKKYITFAWICSAVLWASGCSEDDRTDGYTASDHPVTFVSEVTTDGGVRGALVNDFPEGAQVGLYGYCCDADEQYGTWTWDSKKTHCLPDDNLFDNLPMTFGGGVWDYAGLKYWYTQKDYLYSFFAYYPYNADGVEIETSTGSSWNPDPIGDPVLTYTLPFRTAGTVNTARSQDDVLDVLYANRIDWQNVSGAPVPLTFSHLMTGLEFEVENYGGAPVTIRNLRIEGTFHRSASMPLGRTSTLTVDGTYNGYFPVLSRAVVYPETTSPQKVVDTSGNPIELMLIADYASNSIGTGISIRIDYLLGTGDYVEEVIPIPTDAMTFNPGVKNIVRLEFLGDHLMLSFLPGDSWTLGGDDDIIFD